jgi:hypothetical protein
VGWHRWKNLESIFSSSGSLFYSKKVKKIKKIFFNFLHAFANLWDSGKSAALELEPKTFLILYLLIISYKYMYISWSLPTQKCDGQTDRQAEKLYI